MKKVRIALASMALFLAVGGAFASQFLTQTYYEFDSDNLMCIPHNVDFTCGTSGGSVCSTVVDEVVIPLRPDIQTSCGKVLKRVP